MRGRNLSSRQYSFWKELPTQGSSVRAFLEVLTLNASIFLLYAVLKMTGCRKGMRGGEMVLRGVSRGFGEVTRNERREQGEWGGSMLTGGKERAKAEP